MDCWTDCGSGRVLARTRRLCIECDHRWWGGVSCPRADCRGVGEPLPSVAATLDPRAGGTVATAWELCGLELEDWLELAVGLRVRLAASLFLGWRYSLASPAVPFLPGEFFPSKLVKPALRVTNCSTLTAAVLMAATPEGEWDRASYGRLQVYADQLPDHPGAPVEAAVAAGVAAAGAAGALLGDPPPGLYLVQGWRRLGRKPSGHAFIVSVGSTTGVGDFKLHASSLSGVGAIVQPIRLGELAREYRAGLHVGYLRGT